MKRAIAIVVFALLCVGGYAQQAAVKPPTVTVDITKDKVSAVCEQMVKQTGAKILLEETADIEVSLSVTDMPLEDALTAICKANKLSWRKIYIKKDSPLLRQPDSLASSLRLMEGLAFPEMLIETALDPETLVYTKQKSAVDSIPANVRKDLGMAPVYLISNDEEAKKVKEHLNSRVEKYRKLLEEAMKLFQEMTPEEREQAMALQSRQLQNMDTNSLGQLAMGVLKNPELMQRMNEYAVRMMFSYNAEDRRAVLRQQMTASQYMTDEQKAIIAEDVKAVQAELGMDQGQ